MLTAQDVARRGKNCPLIVGYGGGVNSLAVLLALHENNLVPDLVSFADTRGEKPETYAHLEQVVKPWLKKVGFPELTIVVKNSMYESLEDNCLRKNMLPSRAYGYSSCADKWKIQPQEKFLNHWEPAKAAWVAGIKPIKILGYDAGKRDVKRAAKSKIEDEKLRYWYPLVEWGIDRERCVDLIEAHGLTVPPKSACFFCPSSTKSEVIQLSKEHPELFKRAVQMEQNAKENLGTVKGLGRHWTWEGLVAGTDGQDSPEAPVESCTMCIDEDPEQA